MKWQHVDIAFNKPVTASSILDNKTDQYGPQYATNGQAECGSSSGPVAHTNYEPAAWFRVDLQGKFNITTVVVQPWISKIIRVEPDLKTTWLFYSLIKINQLKITCLIRPICYLDHWDHVVGWS